MVYYLGANLSWFGRQLNSYIIEDDTETTDVNESLNVSYTYDANGLRGSKTVNGVKSDYLYLDGKLVYEKKGDVDIYYNYDSYGNFAGMKWYDAAGTAYALYALTNAQGDVLGLYNGNGELKIAYTYDTWGKVLSETDAQGNPLTGNLIEYSKLNPFRYRGYYYDSETGLYYLQSRYYNPEIGRFLNADGYVTTGQGLLSYNMFAYCLNNPVMYKDETGYFIDGLIDYVNTVVEVTSKTLGSTYIPPKVYKGKSKKKDSPEINIDDPASTIVSFLLILYDELTEVESQGITKENAGKILWDSSVDVSFKIFTVGLGAKLGVKAGALIGTSFSPGIGTTIGAVAGAVATAYAVDYILDYAFCDLREDIKEWY